MWLTMSMSGLISMFIVLRVELFLYHSVKLKEFNELKFDHLNFQEEIL